MRADMIGEEGERSIVFAMGYRDIRRLEGSARHRTAVPFFPPCLSRLDYEHAIKHDMQWRRQAHERP